MTTYNAEINETIHHPAETGSAFVAPEMAALLREAQGYALAITALKGGIGIIPEKPTLTPAPGKLFDAETREELTEQEMIMKLSHDIVIHRAMASSVAEGSNE